MASAHWLLDGGNRIRLVAESGEVHTPTTADVFDACFHGKRDILGFAVASPREEVLGLGFSRFPAEPAMRISAASLGLFRAEFGVAVNGSFCPLEVGDEAVVHDGCWYPVERESVVEAVDWLRHRGLSPDAALTLGQLIALRQDGVPFRVFDEVSTRPADVAAQAAPTFGMVDELAAEPFDYQRTGIAFLRLVASQDIGCILADEMGLGKTLQVIGLLLAETRAGRRPSLVVSPATLLENWRREIAKFAPQLSVNVHAGPERAGNTSMFLGTDVTIVSFETVVRDELLLAGLDWRVVVVDEAQNIRNPEAERTRAIKRLPRRVSVAVTGTPVENRLADLWSLADFALPGLLGDVASFRDAYADDVTDAGRLAPVVAPIVLRRRVADVANDLPDKIEIKQALPMSPRLAQLYEQARRDALAQHGEAGPLVATMRLRQVCAHPSLVGGWHADPAQDMPKYQRLLELMQEAFEAGEKMLVFCSLQDVVDLFMRDVPPRFGGGFFSFIDGRVPVPKRQPIIDAFYEHAGCGALFLNPRAAGAGLNITAANHVVHYTPEWNPALTDQASRRAWRRKQNLPVTIHYLFFANTVEEVMIDRNEFKRQLAEGAVTGHDGSVGTADLMRALQISPVLEAQALYTT